MARKGRQDQADLALCCRDLTFAFSFAGKPSNDAFVKLPCIVGMGLALLGFRGTAEEVPTPPSNGDWCLTIPADVGVLVDDQDAMVLQRLQLGGYAHFHSAFVDGEAGGQDFWYGRGADWRRARLTGKAQVFDVLSFLTHVNMVSDEGRDGGGSEWDYQGLFLAWADLDLKKVTGVDWLDSWTISYGKRKLKELNEEMDTSINTILTVERSSFAAQLVPFRAGTGITGAWMQGSRGRDSFSIGLYTTESSKEFGNWTEGTVVVGAWKHDFSEAWACGEAIFSLGGGIQDVDPGDELYSPWEWVITPWLKVQNGRWILRVSAALGENEGPSTTTGGAFYGASITPEYDLIPDRLQAVVRYTIMGSEAPFGVQLASRYAREAGRPANEDIPILNTGRGDFHHSIYGGLVWWVCPKRMSILGGLEWERLESRDTKIYSGLTGWFSTRLMF